MEHTSILAPYTLKSDEELVRIFQSEDDRKALGVLFKRHSHKVLGLCVHYMKSLHDGEDTAMEVFEILCEKLPQYQIEHFQSWLFNVTKNYCLKKLKRKLKFRGEELTEISGELFVESEAEKTLYSEERLDALSDAIDQLREEQRTCIVMFYLDQKSYKEIEESTRFDYKDVKSHIQNGKRNLRNILKSVL